MYMKIIIISMMADLIYNVTMLMVREQVISYRRLCEMMTSAVSEKFCRLKGLCYSTSSDIWKEKLHSCSEASMHTEHQQSLRNKPISVTFSSHKAATQPTD